MGTDARCAVQLKVAAPVNHQERDMTMVLGTWVPVPGNNPHNEICHTFVYRWLIGRGLITGNYPDPLQELNTFTAPPIL